ncbi:MAG: hypothetical protein RLW87_08030 [Alphaproteobacteria bacterium]
MVPTTFDRVKWWFEDNAPFVSGVMLGATALFVFVWYRRGKI